MKVKAHPRRGRHCELFSKSGIPDFEKNARNDAIGMNGRDKPGHDGGLTGVFVPQPRKRVKRRDAA
jgi:hypothetical protein